MADHKLVTHGAGENLWGECSCGIWCRFLTYHGPKGRLATLRQAFKSHLTEVAPAGAPAAPPDRIPPELVARLDEAKTDARGALDKAAGGGDA